MVTWKKREKLLLIVVIGLAVCWLGERMLVGGLHRRLTTLQREIAAAEVELRTGLRVQQRKDLVLDESRRYSPYLLSGVPEREILARFLKEIEQLAHESGVSIVSFKPDNQPSKSHDFTAYKAQLRAEANVEQLLDLLAKIQNSRLLIKLDQFSLTPKNEQASILTLETTLSMAVP